MEWIDKQTQAETQALVRCRRCHHEWVDGMKYPIVCPRCGRANHWKLIHEGGK